MRHLIHDAPGSFTWHDAAHPRLTGPAVLDLLAAGTDPAPVVASVVRWADAPAAWAGLRGKTVVTREPA